MTRVPSPKEDALRAMREAQFSHAPAPRPPADPVRKAVASIPAKKPKKAKRKGRR